MKTIQRPFFQPGTKVLFFSKGMPHTGIVEKAFENVCEIRDITFLNDKFDTENWTIKTEDLIKTDQFYLPKYPTLSEIVYMQSIVNQCYTNKDCNDLHYERFAKLFPKKTLYKDRVSPFLVECPGLFITLFEPNLIIKRKGDPNHIYTPLELLLPNNQFYIVLEGFESMAEWSMDRPSVISIPYWNDKNHGDKKYARTEVLDAFDAHAFSSGICPEVYPEPDMNEDGIESIWSPNEILMEQATYADAYHSTESKFVHMNDEFMIDIISQNLDRIY